MLIFQRNLEGSSPRARGLKAGGHIRLMGVEVFPACAGIEGLWLADLSEADCLPRVRGDVFKTI